MAFDFKKSLIKVQGGRQYLPVSARIVWFREEHPDWSIVTEPVEINHEKQYAVFRATIFNAEGRIMATGTKKEDAKGFGDYIEKSETGSIGRALALVGYGTQFSPELDETNAGRYADSPQPMGGRFGPNSGPGGRYNQGGYQNGPQRPPQDRMPQEPVRESPAPSHRPEQTRPAPAPARPADEDDFETLISANLRDATEEDPFGDGDAAPSKPSAPAAKAESNGPPSCVGCGRALTKAQQELSIRNYGAAYCPACQKDHARTPAAR